MGRWEVVGFGLVIAIVPALILAGIEAIAEILSPRARDVLHLVFIGFLGAVAALQFVRNMNTRAGIALAVAVAIGVGIALLYNRAEGVRTAFGYLVLAPVFFLVSFLFISDTSKITLQGGANVYSANAETTPPIVLVTFDAFPAQDLLGRDGKIDAQRYPNLAKLA